LVKRLMALTVRWRCGAGDGCTGGSMLAEPRGAL